MNHFRKLGNDICYAKDFVKYIPFIGWHIYLSQHIGIKGCYEQDKGRIERRITQIGENSNAVWVVFMPEGPIFTKERHAEAKKFAIDSNIQPLRYHLIPRTKGFVTTYEALKQQGYKTILNAQIAFDTENYALPKFSNLMQCRSMSAHLYLERIPIDEVAPAFEGIHEVFKKKDALHEYFIKNGNFCFFDNDADIQAIPMQNDNAIKINFVCWSIFWSLLLTFGTYNLIVYYCFQDMKNYSHVVILIRIACEIHDLSFYYYRYFIY